MAQNQQPTTFRIFCNGRLQVEVPDHVIGKIPIVKRANTIFRRANRTGRPSIDVPFDQEVVKAIIDWVDYRVHREQNYIAMDNEFIPNATVEELAKCLPAAIYFDQEVLADRIAERMAEGLRGMTPEDIRHVLGITNDLTEAEDAALKAEEEGLELEN